MTLIRVATALLVVALAGSGCGFLPDDLMVPAESRAAADQLERDLAEIEGVADAEVSIQHESDGYDPSSASLTLSSGASEAGLAAVIEAVPGLVADAGLAHFFSAGIALGHDAWVKVGFADEDGVRVPSRPIDPAATARVLFRLIDVVGDQATVSVESPLDARLTFEEGAERDLSPVLHEALADPVLSDGDITWDAIVFTDTDKPIPYPIREVGAGPGRLAATLRGYDGIVASYDAAPPEVASFTVKASSAGRRGVSLSTEMIFEPEVTDADLTPAVWGERLEPVLAAQAATVDALGRGSSLDVIRQESTHSMRPFFTHPNRIGSASLFSPTMQDWVRMVARG